MSYIDVLSKPQQKDFGKLDKEYVRNGMTVKLYLPDMPETERIRADIQIRERVLNIVSELTCDRVAS